MDEKMRTLKLEELKKGKAEISGIRLNYMGQDKIFNVYRIPLEYLVYNPYNGRIGTKVKTFEARNHTLNSENPDDVQIIEDYLWESNTERNKKTLANLRLNGQREYGIVSKNGVIIDGNRRVSLMKRIIRKSNSQEKTAIERCRYFNAIILDERADKKEILKLETTYQMGQDEKLDYNAPEKYLKCKELQEEGFTITEIADMMGETKSNIEKNLEILEVMDEYLSKFDYTNMYSMLDKREGQFVDLTSYKKQFTKNNNKANWIVDDEDISDLLNISFDYIRAQYEGKDFRKIGNTANTKGVPRSFFSDYNIWKKFKKEHYQDMHPIKEASVDEYLKKEGGKKDINVILNDRDNTWMEQTKNIFKKNMRKYGRVLEDTQAAKTPAVLLKDIKEALELIDTDQATFYDDEVYNLICKVNTKTYEFKKLFKSVKKNEQINN